MSHLPADIHKRLNGVRDTRKVCTCDGAGRGPGRECVVGAGRRLGELCRCAKGLEPPPPPPSAWQGLTELERAAAVRAICEYGTGFVTPLFSVIEGIERTLAERNAMPGVGACCGDYARCTSPCTPRGRWLERRELAAERKPLTDDQVDQLCVGIEVTAASNRGRLAFLLARAVELAHGIGAARGGGT